MSFLFIMEKKYYSIREVAEKIGEPQSTLRFWEKEIPLLNPGKSAGGTRRYVQKDIDLLKEINEKNNVIVKFTITTPNDELSRIIEPNVCVSSKRFAALPGK